MGNVGDIETFDIWDMLITVSGQTAGFSLMEWDI